MCTSRCYLDIAECDPFEFTSDDEAYFVLIIVNLINLVATCVDMLSLSNSVC